jgi:hypothetical protein
MNPKAASKLEHQQASENQPGKLTDLVLLLTKMEIFKKYLKLVTLLLKIMLKLVQ